MKLRYIILFVIAILHVSNIFSQIENFSQDFIFPVKIDPVLTGGFAEPRTRHFHGGIDFRTYQNGVPIYSVAEGYISRISISPWGYGKAIYVTHPNNYTSVYAHLNNYNDEIEAFVKSVQYSIKSYDFDTTIQQNLIMVNQGDIIAYSGNTGSSEGPHLHFEIRETDTQKTVNTLNSVYKIRDNVKPEVYGIVLYPKSENDYIDGDNNKVYKKTSKNADGIYTINGDTVIFNGEIGIGVDYVDRMSGTHNRFGAKHLKLYLDNNIIYHSEMSKISFSNQSQKNSVFDYEYLIKNKKHVHKAFREPNNTKSIFKELINDGYIKAESKATYDVKIEVIDFFDNISEINFVLKLDESKSQNIKKTKLISYTDYFLFLDDGVRVEIDSSTLFYDQKIEIKKLKNSKYSGRYSIGNDLIIPKKPFYIYLELNDLAKEYKEYLYVSCIHNNRDIFHEAKVLFGKAFCIAKHFGIYELKIDTTAPKIRPINIRDGANMQGKKYLEFTITDDLSGIGKIDLFVNDQWLLPEYEPKTSSVRHYFDDRLLPNQTHKLRFEVSDRLNNKGIYECSFDY